MSNQLKTIKTGIAKMQGEFGKALPAHIPSERFVRTAQTAISNTRNIEKVKDAASLYSAVAKAAADGLIIDGREAALVIDYHGAVQYRPMMRGLLKLAYNSGQVKGLVVEVVRENDYFKHNPTNFAEPVHHEVKHDQERGEPIVVYALAAMKDGGIVHEVMSVADVNRIRDRSDAWRAFKNNKIKSTPWSTDWSEMARKTVFRRLSKYLPSSTDNDRLHGAAERIDEDYTFEIDGNEPEAQPTPVKKRGAAASALKDVTPAQEPEKAPEPPQEPKKTQQASKGESENPAHEPDHDPETGEIVEPSDAEPQEGDVI